MNNVILNNLFEKKVELQQRVDAIEADFSEQITENENNEVLNEIHHEAKLELGLINHAIARFENDEYGICSQCTEAINPDRLKVLPYIDTCINCAK